ncbi:MAG: ankyrin repeat domain-containing protein, partial [Spirochaetia bacterium]|nr:ankyrin repeat domain-containing protein [Spirochaetia bacterium]
MKKYLIKSILTVAVLLIASCTSSETRYLIEAIDSGRKDEAIRMIQSGTEVNGSVRYNMTPLYYAVFRGHYDIAEMLVKSGAETESRETANGETILMAAASRKDSYPYVKLLVEYGAEINPRRAKNTWPVLTHAAASGNIASVRYLIKNGADLSYHKGFKSPLIIAAEYAHFSIVRLLIESGVNPNETDAEGRTALYSAQYFGEKSYSAEEKKRFKEIENYLKKQGAREYTGLRL